MGFAGLAKPSTADKPALKGVSVDFLHRHECKVCPLNNISDNKHPHMQPVGSKQPVIYVLGPAPTKQDDREGEPFSGVVGDFIRDAIPDEWHSKIRWGNCVRTKPKTKAPEVMELECCRPSIVKDIEATKPKAIFGIGPVPLKWVLNRDTITYWNGRKVPVQIGDHKCWFFPMLDPDYIMWKMDDKASEGRNLEFVFNLDMQRALYALDNLTEPDVHTVERASQDIEIITGDGGWSDVVRVKELLLDMYDAKVVGFDYETNCLRPYATGSKFLTVALSSKDRTFAFALQHKQAQWTDEQYKQIRLALKHFIYRAEGRKISHNLPFEMEWTAVKFGNQSLRAGFWGDSIGQAYVLDERPKTHDLDFMCLQHFGLSIKAISNLDRKNLDSAPLEAVLKYNAIDARYHRLLYLAQLPMLKAEQLMPVYEHQLRRTPAVVLTQIKGVPTDQDEVNQFYEKYSNEKKKIEEQLAAVPSVQRFKKLKGKAYRPSSTHDIAFVLRTILKLNVDKTDEITLKTVKDPIAKLTLKWRKANKLYSTYVTPYKEGGLKSNLWPDGLLHPVLAITSTRTWRTSANGPNIQNQPKRTEGKVIRKQVKPGGDKRVCAFDYAGIQARNVAMESRDKTLVKYFWEKYDIHTDWTNRLVKYYPQWIEGGAAKLQDKAIFKAYRNRAKNEFVFPSFFGAIPRSLAGYLGIPEEIAEQLHKDFWNEFPDIKSWHKRLHKLYEETGYVTGLSEFRRRAPISVNEIINSPIQADESIIVLTAHCALSEKEDMRFQPNMEIHDDLTFIWDKHEIEKNAEVVIREMTRKNFDWINVPLVVEMSVGKDWASLETVGEFSSDGWDGSVKYALEKPDPNSGSWSDGTGWANHKGNEKARKHHK